MKYYLLLLILFSSTTGYGQKIKRDTIRVVRLYADTGYQYRDNVQGQFIWDVVLRTLWEVREWHSTSEGVIDPYAQWGYKEQWYPRHIKYLSYPAYLEVPSTAIIFEDAKSIFQ